MQGKAEWIDGSLNIPDLLRAAPQVRPVLDRYGLKGCGGPMGPAESLAFFARAHDVPLARLLAELREAARPTSQPIALPLADSPSRTDTIYRPFFKAGMAVTLTLGALWGAYLLLRIAVNGSFRAAGLHEINAHGHAQIFGWVGLFVMGFAYQAFPRFKHTTLSHPNLALVSLWLMLTGLLGRSVLEPLSGVLAWAGPAAVASSTLEIAAIVLFVAILAATWRASGKPLAFYDYYILCSLVWFIVQAVYESVYLAATLHVGGREELITLVATWQGALRDVQIHGFALLMILGVSQRLFHHFYGLPAPNQRLSRVALVCLNAALVGEVLGLILHRLTGPAWIALWYASVLVLAGTVAALVWNWRIFAAPAEPDRTLKFLRAAYLWLLASLAMLVLLPVHQHLLLPWLAPDSEAARLHFSHAYFGAIRHAVTVGFISLMIVGVAARVVPTLNGVYPRRLPKLWGPFLLLNGGCALRVAGQTLTDFVPVAFPITGVSGVLEVLGLTLWAVHLWRIMAGRFALEMPEASPPPIAEGAIAASDGVSAILDRYPA
ncbi:MAG TPA: NnrS family protein, partial [Gemmataceae bacterium]